MNKISNGFLYNLTLYKTLINIAVERIITKSFARLMGRGTHRGFITYEGIKANH